MFGHQAHCNPNKEAFAKQSEQLKTPVTLTHESGGGRIVMLQDSPAKVRFPFGTHLHVPFTQSPFPLQKFPPLKQGGISGVQV